MTKPNVRFALLAALLALLAACASEPTYDILTVAAPSEFLGATVVLDGTVVGTLEHLQTHGTLFEAAMKRLHPDSPLPETVALNIPIVPSRMRVGVHEARLERSTRSPLVGAFSYPFISAERQCLLFPALAGLEASPSCAAPRK